MENHRQRRYRMLARLGSGGAAERQEPIGHDARRVNGDSFVATRRPTHDLDFLRGYSKLRGEEHMQRAVRFAVDWRRFDLYLQPAVVDLFDSIGFGSGLYADLQNQRILTPREPSAAHIRARPKSRSGATTSIRPRLYMMLTLCYTLMVQIWMQCWELQDREIWV